VDKLSRGAAADRIHALADTLSLEESQLIPFSAVTGEGRDDLAAAIAALAVSG
jgi:GTP-binding protein